MSKTLVIAEKPSVVRKDGNEFPIARHAAREQHRNVPPEWSAVPHRHDLQRRGHVTLSLGTGETGQKQRQLDVSLRRQQDTLFCVQWKARIR